MQNTSKPTPNVTTPKTLLHAAVNDPAEIERIKAEFAAKMRESRKTWPGRKREKART